MHLSRLNQTLDIAGRIAPAMTVAAGLAAAPMLDHGSTMCFSRQHFDVSCPSCGMTRAIGSLMRGDLDHSFAMNPVGAVLTIQAVLLAAAFASGKKAFKDKAWSLWIPAALVFDVVALIGTWAIRLVDGTLPPP